jgi:hypothetical protein
VKKPSRAPRPAAKSTVNPGGPMRAAPSPAPRAAPAPARRVNPGGPRKAAPGHKAPAAHKKPAAKKKPAPRKLALGDAVACCSAEALAASLRLAGGSVSDDDVLALYWLTAGDADAGAPILGTLEAARGYGIGGCFPAGYRPAGALDFQRSVLLGLALPAGPHAVACDGARWWSWGEPYDPADFPGAVIEEAWVVTW